jgi:hypothetical protein
LVLSHQLKTALGHTLPACLFSPHFLTVHG